MSSTLDFTLDLVRRQSVTPLDGGCQQLISDRLAEAGFSTERLVFGDVTNLWAWRGSGAPVLCFAGHTDVVPAGPLTEWRTGPFEPTINAGTLYGRGVADMKSSLAAMVDAATAFCTEQPNHRGTVAFLLTSDEEGKAQDGTRRVMQHLAERGTRIDWCIIGEPSCEAHLGDQIRIGRRGSLSGILTVHGVAGHVAYPHLAQNPVQQFAPVLAELYATPLDNGNDDFPPSSFQVVRLESTGDAVNVTPASLTTRFNFRYSTVWTHERLKTHVEALLKRHKLDFTLQWHLSGEPFLTRRGRLTDLITQAVSAVTGRTPALSTGGGTSDGRFIAPYGVDVVEFGPVNSTIHKPNEEIPVADIEQLRQTYRKAIELLLADD